MLLYKEESKVESKVYKNVAQTRNSCSAEQRVDISFSSSSGHFENIKDEDFKDWSDAYPSIDVQKEIIKAEQWLKAHPNRSKKKLWRKFLLGWFTRSNDSAENKAAYRSNSRSNSSLSGLKDSKFRSWEKSYPKDNWSPPEPKLEDFA